MKCMRNIVAAVYFECMQTGHIVNAISTRYTYTLTWCALCTHDRHTCPHNSCSIDLNKSYIFICERSCEWRCHGCCCCCRRCYCVPMNDRAQFSASWKIMDFILNEGYSTFTVATAFQQHGCVTAHSSQVISFNVYLRHTYIF